MPSEGSMFSGVTLYTVHRLFLIGAQFSAQVFAIHPYEELIGAWGVVFHSVIQIVVNDAGTRSEGYLAIEVREEVESVVMMVLGDGEV